MLQPSMPKKQSISAVRCEGSVVHLLLGKMLGDENFRDLFERDPERAATTLNVSITTKEVAKLRDYLVRLGRTDASLHCTISGQINAHERRLQY
jgi:hypothetical protein